MTFSELLRRGPLWLDGGMGSLLQAQGLQPGEAPETWAVRHPERITAVHRAYYDAGSDLVLTDTFGVNPLRYDDAQCEAMIRAAVDCAKLARSQCAPGKARYVGLDIGPCGKLLEPFGPLGFEEAVAAFAKVIRAGAACGVDCVFIETMNDMSETRAALLAARENCALPVLVSNAYGADGKLMTGGTPEAVVAMLEGMGADAVGVNCSLGPDALAPVVERYLRAASVPVLMKPNAGLPVERDGKTVYDVGPEDFARAVTALMPKGLRIMGGCCGTTPEHLRALVAAAQGVSIPPLETKHDTVVSSRGRAVNLREGPVMIGERINPTGKKRFRQALAEGDMAYVLSEGIAQEDRGVQMLDVNVGAPGVDEAGVLAQVVCELQAVTDLPLQIDTADPAAMERALRLYTGKAMVNSVNGSAAVMRQVFPLVRKYGGVVVALTLDENGIPETAEGRLTVAERILKEAETYGIDRKDVVFDPLTMTVSAGSDAALVTLEALRLIRERTGCCTVLGVSNVSFGLPAREVIGSAFLTMALHAGLSAAIMNPKSDAMLGAYRSYMALTGRDPNCSAYVAFGAELPAAVSNGPAAKKDRTEPDARGLRQAVARGLREEAARLAEAGIASGREPLALVQEEIIPALDDVGRGFEAKTVFLPQLMMSAEAAEAAFSKVKAAMGAHGRPAARSRIVLATVKGDVHDIGKNIVRLLLENYGYEVTDLGKDAAPEKILEAVRRLRAPICGLSALMTTTVPAMAETIALLHAETPWCRVMVGGAVLTEAYAQEIGADAYARDAMAAVRCAERLEQETGAR